MPFDDIMFILSERGSVSGCGMFKFFQFSLNWDTE